MLQTSHCGNKPREAPTEKCNILSDFLKWLLAYDTIATAIQIIASQCLCDWCKLHMYSEGYHQKARHSVHQTRQQAWTAIIKNSVETFQPREADIAKREFGNVWLLRFDFILQQDPFECNAKSSLWRPAPLYQELLSTTTLLVHAKTICCSELGTLFKIFQRTVLK